MTPKITDPEVLAFIERVDRLTPPGSAARSIADQRALYNAMSDAFRADRPDGLRVRDRTISGVPCRSYGGEQPVRAIFLHGGGFVVGGLESHDDVAAELSHATGLPVDAVDYRLAPENPHPAAYEDALTVVEAASRPVILIGDSAGGTLAASVAWKLRGTGKVAGQVLIYPALGGLSLGLPSYTECAEAPLLTTDDIHAYGALRGRSGGETPDPTYHVLAAEDLSRVAPTFISAAGVDPLRDDGVVFAQRLRDAGVEGACEIEEQLPHMWLRARHQSRRAGAAFDRVIRWTRRLAAKSTVR
ncbi:MAG: alpha/beta hydrolase [Pseudomonadota bacterium]